MNRTERLEFHPEDGDLIRFLDHELERGDCHRVMAHISSCEECSERLESFGEQLRGLSALIEQIGVPQATLDARREEILAAVQKAATRPARRRGFMQESWLRAAATIAVVMTSAMAVQPVRAWVADQFGRLTQGTRIEQPVIVNSSPASTAAPVTTVTFTPAEAVFTLSLSAPQLTGSLEFVVDNVDAASIEITGVVQDVAMLPSAVHITNTAQTGASYRVVLPSHVTLVRIERNGETLAEYGVGALPWSHSVDLTP